VVRHLGRGARDSECRHGRRRHDRAGSAHEAECLALKDNKRAILSAASHAQRAADFLHGLHAKRLESPFNV
jgi:antirestriction protein ArdC